MQNQFIDIHTHKHYTDGTTYIFSCAIGKDRPPTDGTLFSAGIHPWAAGHVDLLASIGYLRTAPIVAVGEIGLDYAIDTTHDLQKEVFEAQLSIAGQRKLPVIIHCVRAHNDVLSTLKEYDLKTVIFHGYIGSPEQTETIIERGCYLSFDERSLASPKTVESLRSAPLDRIFAETDDSEVPVSVIYKRIAELRGMTEEELQGIICENFKRIFQ